MAKVSVSAHMPFIPYTFKTQWMCLCWEGGLCLSHPGSKTSQVKWFDTAHPEHQETTVEEEYGFDNMGVSQNGGTQQPWGVPTKNDDFGGVKWGYYHSRKHPYRVFAMSNWVKLWTEKVHQIEFIWANSPTQMPPMYGIVTYIWVVLRVYMYSDIYHTLSVWDGKNINLRFFTLLFGREIAAEIGQVVIGKQKIRIGPKKMSSHEHVPKYNGFSSWWISLSTPWRNVCKSKLDHFPKDQGENLKDTFDVPPPSCLFQLQV